MINEKNYPWGPDFMNEGTLGQITTCDGGATEYRSYDRDDDNDSYWGATISINGEVRYYIFSPNPYSMSPITFSFVKDEGGKLREITQDARDKLLRLNAPNLYAFLNEEDNDAEHETFD